MTETLDVPPAPAPRPAVDHTGVTPAAVLAGLGTAVPPTIVTNDDLVERGLATSDEWIRTRTGIAQRHVADAGTTTADLAVEAGARALADAGIDEVDTVVVATTTPDRLIPNTAPEVASRLGSTRAAAFDVNGACAGFIVGLATVAGLIATGVSRSALLIGAETITRLVDPYDRNTAILFGDGAGAVVVRAGEAGEFGTVGPFDLAADGSRADLLEVPAGGSRRPSDAASVAAGAHWLRMDGREVYRQAVAHMARSCEVVLERAGIGVDDVDRLVGHQANARILEAVADRLGVDPSRCVVNVDRYGNTSAASVPLALADAGLRPGERVLLTAFGAGLTWGSALLTWPGDTDD